MWNAAPNTHRGDRLDLLVTLVEAFERKHGIVPPDPIKGVGGRQ
jgi:hypothetical protein